MSDAIADAVESIESATAAALSSLSPVDRGEVCRVVHRALNVYVTAAKFENPPKFKIPDYLTPILEQPAPPRGT